jgi:hypothetical protein
MEAERKARIEKVLQQKLALLQNELGVHIDELRKEFDIADS